MKGVIEQEFWQHRMHVEVLACFGGEAERKQMERVLEFGLYQEIAEVFTIGHFGD